MEHGCRPSLLCRLPSLLLLAQLPTWGSADEFQVISPSVPVVAELGGDTILPCSLVPAMNAEDMELRWFHTKFSEVVFIYRNHREEYKEQMPQYAGRTLLVRDFLTIGEAAVHIQKVQASDNGTYTCFFQKGGHYAEAILELQVAEPFFPQASPWKAAFAGILTVLGFLLFGAGCFTWREHSAKLQERQKQEKLRWAKEEDQRAEEEALKARDELQAELGRRKTAYLVAWRKAQLYADWRKERFQAWPVTLDLESTDESLVLSPDKMSVTWKYITRKDILCPVRGLEGITSGRCYWEVEIRSGVDSWWSLGVCRENVTRTGMLTVSPDMGFWIVMRIINKYYARTKSLDALSLRQDPRRVGIFLDYSEGDVSFYNMTDGSHIFSFPPTSFSGTLLPYFTLKGDVTLSICPTEGASEGLPVPLSKSSSLEEAVRPPGEGLSSGSGVDGAPPGAESPLLP